MNTQEEWNEAIEGAVQEITADGCIIANMDKELLIVAQTETARAKNSQEVIRLETALKNAQAVLEKGLATSGPLNNHLCGTWPQKDRACEDKFLELATFTGHLNDKPNSVLGVEIFIGIMKGVDSPKIALFTSWSKKDGRRTSTEPKNIPAFPEELVTQMEQFGEVFHLARAIIKSLYKD